MNDPELKAMSCVFDALQGLDQSTQKRVVDWVLAKLQSSGVNPTKGVKRGPKPGSKRSRIRDRKLANTSESKTIYTKRGPKPGSKKRGPKLGTGGRPKSSGKKSSVSRRGRPRKITTP